MMKNASSSASPSGIEPETLRLTAARSDQLSYREQWMLHRPGGDICTQLVHRACKMPCFFSAPARRKEIGSNCLARGRLEMGGGPRPPFQSKTPVSTRELSPSLSSPPLLLHAAAARLAAPAALGRPFPAALALAAGHRLRLEFEKLRLGALAHGVVR